MGQVIMITNDLFRHMNKMQQFSIQNGSINCYHSQGNYTKTQVSLACNYRKIYYNVSINKGSNLFVKY